MIALQDLTVQRGSFALTGISLTVNAGGYATVIGPSGAGKTTLLEAVAGVLPVTSGRIRLRGADATRTPAERRRVGIVYQHGFLFPHLDVRANVAYGAAQPADVTEAADRFGVTGLLDRSVSGLSGGERQLVALARATARAPDILLLDEPFASLDQRTRRAAHAAIRALRAERSITIIHVTHDLAEAGALGDVTLLLDRGRSVQLGTPESIFHRPANAAAAEFVGAENVLAGNAVPIRASAASAATAAADDEEADEMAVAFTTGALTLYAVGGVMPGPAHAVIRAEEIALSREAATSSVRNQFQGVVAEVRRHGPIARVTVDVQGVLLVAAITSRSLADLEIGVGGRVVAGFKATAVHLC